MSSMAAFCLYGGVDYMTDNNLIDDLNDHVNLDDLLKSYLDNNNAGFKSLTFYNIDSADPKDRITISQKDIITEIITCSANALSGNYYHDFFVTASTGSGKSMLFQLAAYYYSKIDKSVLIIVIEPLIALMHDQVDGIRKKGHTFAAYLDSTCTVNMRDKILNDLKNNNISLLYVSPEMFVAKELEDVFTKRKKGLFVIDEAHTVTTWGRDFRPDYYFLTHDIQKLRKAASFPVLCLTATAVYGGLNDTVNKTIDAFSLIDPMIRLGVVRRDDIRFSFKKLPRGLDKSSTYDHKRSELMPFLDDKIKSLVYFAYAKEVQETKDDLWRWGYKNNVGIYYGDLDKSRKDRELSGFRDNKTTMMLCTKAFGMGVDIPDIVNCYHLEPTGELEDYVQEIGRCARDETIQGTAYYSYSKYDINKVEFLHDISFIRPGHVNYMLRKIDDEIVSAIKKSKQYKHEVFLSPDEFLFFDKRKDGEKSDPVNKMKLCLLLISKVVNSKNKNKMIVYPNTVSTGCLVFVSSAKIDIFETTYNGCFNLIEENYNSLGNMYTLDIYKVWQQTAPDKSFADFKQSLLWSDKNLFVRYLHIIVETYQSSLDDIIGIYKDYMDVLRSTLISLKKKPFLYSDFECEFVKSCEQMFSPPESPENNKDEMIDISPDDNTDTTEESVPEADVDPSEITAVNETEETIAPDPDTDDTDADIIELDPEDETADTSAPAYADIAYLLFSLFVMSDEEITKRKKHYYLQNDDNGYSLITKAKTNIGDEQKYKVIANDNKDFEALSFDVLQKLKNQINDIFPNGWVNQAAADDDNAADMSTFDIYCVHSKSYSTFFALDVLRILDLINYRVNGGIEPKIKLIVNGRFSVFNTSKKCRELINEENHRFQESISFLNDFLCADISSDQRWDAIEHYFLGNMDAAKALLDGNTAQKAATSDDDT